MTKNDNKGSSSKRRRQPPPDGPDAFADPVPQQQSMPTDPEPTPTDPREPPSEEFFSNWWLVSDGGGPLTVMPDFGHCVKKYPKAPLRATPPN